MKHLYRYSSEFFDEHGCGVSVLSEDTEAGLCKLNSA
jgi:hypothetical protein